MATRDYSDIVPGNAGVTSGFDPARVNPVTHRIYPHNGVDIAAAAGSAVLSPYEGKVVLKGSGDDRGYWHTGW